jgi:hypothetical protein
MSAHGAILTLPALLVTVRNPPICDIGKRGESDKSDDGTRLFADAAGVERW